ncbi:hypothetical protein PSTG_11871 [Puccinia striiformis f. sp. tritici PST-78]|uniref:Uncharacterized protein n=1 Tax=Puccinia striiformis f. sp. tritici PST-78 TaxID=1165861 RepID=A0A0L0V6Z3_9BASI|nr:hypothetical protein PSTG_11871 [Puccinia striiformis f. sp. tritici PST-78]
MLCKKYGSNTDIAYFQDRSENLQICGIVSDNASNSKVMKKAAQNTSTINPDDSGDSNDEDEDAEGHIQVLEEDGDDSSSEDKDAESEAESVVHNDRNETKSLDLDDIKNTSDEDKFNTYTTDGCKQSLAKVSHSTDF